jgi:pyrroline-5-carboxylate reductase
VSIVAGAPIRMIADGLANASVVRVMPNTPARIGMGMSVWTATSEVRETERNQARALLMALGEEVFVKDEDYLDMATALSGTGPAYVFMFLEAMVDAGVHLGFSRHVAEKLVLQTMRGSVEYAAQSGEHLASLRNQVTSPGGTSAEAIYQLEKGGLRTVVARAICAAYQRSVGLGGGRKFSRLAGRHPDDNGDSDTSAE